MLTNPIYKEIKDLLLSIKIISPTKFLFQHQLYDSRLRLEYSMLDSINTDKYMSLSLKDLLYRICHCRNASFIKERISEVFQQNDIQDFIGLLCESNAGNGTWSPGWRILKIEKDGQLAVEKNGLTIWISPRYFVSIDDMMKVGKKGCIMIAKDYLRLVPGFYVANSNATFIDEYDDDITVRMYWNIARSHASLLMKYLTAQLNLDEIPFQFKILNNPNHYPRADAAILYIHKQYYSISNIHISKIYSKLKDFLNAPTPLFTKKLAPGLSLAEDPNNNESFGEHRCSILAEALYDISTKNFISIEERIKEIVLYFANRGINLDEPYLNPHSVDDYNTIHVGALD
jgi:HopA1 effector protein family